MFNSIRKKEVQKLYVSTLIFKSISYSNLHLVVNCKNDPGLKVKPHLLLSFKRVI